MKTAVVMSVVVLGATFLAVPAQAAAPSQITGDARAVRSIGAEFTSASGCVTTAIDVFAQDPLRDTFFQHNPDGAVVQHFTDSFGRMQIQQWDCGGNLVLDGFGFGGSPLGGLTIAHDLTSATLQTTIPVDDAVSGSTLNYTIDLSWTAIPPIGHAHSVAPRESHAISHDDNAVDNFLYNDVGKGYFASVAGSVSDGANTYAPDDVSNAFISEDVSKFLQIGGGFASAASAGRLRSSLDGRSTLPHAIPWIARPPKPYSKIAKVQFLIDGKLRWVETKRPYVYGGDSDALVTSWLAPGKHTFTVRALRRGAATLTRTTKATVVATPPPPQELGLTSWTRRLTEQGRNGSPAGVWKLYVSAAGWQISDPLGGTNFIDSVYGSGNVVRLGYGIWTRPHSTHEGNGWCEDTNNVNRYGWALAGNTLTLALSGNDNCGGQAEVLSGTWTRA